MVRPPAWKVTGWSTQGWVAGFVIDVFGCAEVVAAWPQAARRPRAARTAATRRGEEAMSGSDAGGAPDRGDGALGVGHRHDQPAELGFVGEVHPDRRTAALDGGEVLTAQKPP